MGARANQLPVPAARACGQPSEDPIIGESARGRGKSLLQLANARLSVWIRIPQDLEIF